MSKIKLQFGPFLANIIAEHKTIEKLLKNSVYSPVGVGSSSNKSKSKKHSKSKPNNQYKSTKPIKSKAVTQFRNKSNI